MPFKVRSTREVHYAICEHCGKVSPEFASMYDLEQWMQANGWQRVTVTAYCEWCSKVPHRPATA